MTDFLLELRSEEIPARMQAKAREDLARLFTDRLRALGVTWDATETYATPRRLALIVRGLPETTAPLTEERKGPRADAPAAAIDGFLRSTGLTRDALVERTDPKGATTLFAVIERPGVPVPSVLANACAHVVHAFPWPKAMRWGDASASTESLRWVRPLQGIVALFGDRIVPFEIAGMKSGAATVGHRFHHPGSITIGSAADYVEKLRASYVIVDQAERAAIIATGATMLTKGAGLTLIRDEALLAENAGLTEWPVPLLGRFDAEFLAVPPEVIQLTARVNQKYFVCHDGDGKLANAFVCVANIDAADGGDTIVEGNRKVLAARLSDARFFYDTDLKVPLEEQAKKLDKIVFHEKLGTVADKVDRVAKLARWLVEEGIIKSSPSLLGEGDHAQHGGGAGSVAEGVSVGSAADPSAPGFAGGPTPPGKLGEDLANQAERAARLCKADLVTGMVGEFPELQGLIGSYYAAAQGEDPAIAAAIRDHYKPVPSKVEGPVGQGDEVPTDPVTVAVSLADKLDTLMCFFAIDEKPTGSKDPFALRRAALSVIRLILENGLRFSIDYTLETMTDVIAMGWPEEARDGDRYDRACSLDRLLLNQIATGDAGLHWFIIDRFKVQQRDHGVPHDMIDAALKDDDLVRLLARVRALQAFVTTADGANLLAGYKRAANILKKEGHETSSRHPGLEPGSRLSAEEAGPRLGGRGDDGTPAPQKTLSYTPEIAEAALTAALDAAEPAAAAAVGQEDFEAAMAALATLRAPIDAFFDSVTVNDPAPEKREARLVLLARVRDAVHTVADFSKIEG